MDVSKEIIEPLRKRINTQQDAYCPLQWPSDGGCLPRRGVCLGVAVQGVCA